MVTRAASRSSMSLRPLVNCAISSSRRGLKALTYSCCLAALLKQQLPILKMWSQNAVTN